MSPPWSTVEEMVAAQAAGHGGEPAILAPGREPLTFARLQDRVEEIRLRLWELGAGLGDVVVSVLPNGPDAAAAIVAVSSCATLAPLNPDAQLLEYQNWFRELEPKLVLAPPGLAQPAREVAGAMGVPVIDVAPASEAGAFTLDGAVVK